MMKKNRPFSHNAIIQNINRFISLNQEEEDLYLSFLTEKKFKKKEFPLIPGSIAKFDYYIVKGCLKVYLIDNRGVEHISMFAVEDWWTGDLSSFLTQEPTSYFIQALEVTEVLQISKTNFDSLFDQIPKFERFYRIIFQKSLISQIQRSDDNISLSAEGKYLSFIEKYPFLINRISQKDIAAYIGVTPEFLSNIKRKITFT